MNDLIYIAVIGLFFYLLLNNKDQSKNNLTLLLVILGFIFYYLFKNGVNFDKLNDILYDRHVNTKKSLNNSKIKREIEDKLNMIDSNMTDYKQEDKKEGDESDLIRRIKTELSIPSKVKCKFKLNPRGGNNARY